jgi:hypothetical protein
MLLLERKRLSAEEKEAFNLSEDYTDYVWVTTKEILEGHYPVWLKEEISKLTGKKPQQS